jgi:hypothetical protein
VFVVYIAKKSCTVKLILQRFRDNTPASHLRCGFLLLMNKILITDLYVMVVPFGVAFQDNE